MLKKVTQKLNQPSRDYVLLSLRLPQKFSYYNARDVLCLIVIALVTIFCVLSVVFFLLTEFVTYGLTDEKYVYTARIDALKLLGTSMAFPLAIYLAYLTYKRSSVMEQTLLETQEQNREQRIHNEKMLAETQRKTDIEKLSQLDSQFHKYVEMFFSAETDISKISAIHALKSVVQRDPDGYMQPVIAIFVSHVRTFSTTISEYDSSLERVEYDEINSSNFLSFRREMPLSLRVALQALSEFDVEIDLSNTIFLNLIFDNISVDKFKFKGSSFFNVKFENFHAKSDAFFDYSQFVICDFLKSSIKNSSIIRSKFQNCTFLRFSFEGSNLSGTIFPDLWSSFYKGTNHFYQVDVKNSSLVLCSLPEKLSGVENLTLQQLKDTEYSHYTSLPNHLKDKMPELIEYCKYLDDNIETIDFDDEED